VAKDAESPSLWEGRATIVAGWVFNIFKIFIDNDTIIVYHYNITNKEINPYFVVTL